MSFTHRRRPSAVRRVAPLLPVAALAAMATSAPARAGEFASAHTRHDYQKCAARPSPHPDVVEIRRCRGHAGIPVLWTSEPDSSSVAFGSGTPGAIPGLDTFFEAGEAVEWRGPVVAGTVKPLAAIVRYDTGASVGRLGSARLVVYRLTDGASCLMGTVPRLDAAAARAMVDRHAAGFVCGRSRPIPPT